MKTVAQRIADAIEVNPITGCWEWQRRLDRDGYGVIKIGGRAGRPHAAHRVSYETHVGAIPSDLQLDHLCRVRCCVNPEHLEPVTTGENTRRSPWNSATVCRNGHERTADTNYITPAGIRTCRECHRLASVAYRERLTP